MSNENEPRTNLDLTELPRPCDGECPPVLGVVQRHVRLCDHPTRASRGGVQLVHLLQRHRDGLLAQDMSAGVERATAQELWRWLGSAMYTASMSGSARSAS